jgi:hypothetical protein
VVWIGNAAIKEYNGATDKARLGCPGFLGQLIKQLLPAVQTAPD